MVAKYINFIIKKYTYQYTGEPPVAIRALKILLPPTYLARVQVWFIILYRPRHGAQGAARAALRWRRVSMPFSTICNKIIILFFRAEPKSFALIIIYTKCHDSPRCFTETMNRIDKYTCLRSKAASSAALCGTARTERNNKTSASACQKVGGNTK